MLQSQINYWNLQEQKRHNLLTEQAANQQAEASMISATASRTQSEIAKELMPFEKMKAESSRLQADASLKQAEAALQNVEVNRGNLAVNQMNAETNRQNADTNRYNADINAWNAAVNQQNANINQQNANTNAFNAETNRIMTESNVERNQVQNIGTIVSAGLDAQRKETEEEKTKQEQIHTQFTTANEVVGLAESGSKTIQNVTGSVSNVVNTLRDKRNNNNKQGNASGNFNLWSNSISAGQLDQVKKVLPIISALVP